VTRAGRFVRLSEARVRPTPPGGRLPIAVAARRPRMLELVAEHADVWDVNLPAIPERVAAAARRLGEACARRGRDPASVERSMLLFARAGASLDAARHEFRERNPWFAAFGDAEIEPGLVVGEAAACRARLAELAETLGLALPVLDLSGLAAEAARRQLEACSAGG
jgi:alkanesulfonate monooxygenase SsuD/methylene tetrahydromethanopterin reductase-like flavin-dependent oxidoreductase (luciferase family)